MKSVHSRKLNELPRRLRMRQAKLQMLFSTRLDSKLLPLKNQSLKKIKKKSSLKLMKRQRVQ